MTRKGGVALGMQHRMDGQSTEEETRQLRGKLSTIGLTECSREETLKREPELAQVPPILRDVVNIFFLN